MPKKSKKSATSQYVGANAPRRWFTQPFPDESCVTLTYQTEVDSTATVGLVGPYRMSLNGPYDPDVSGTGSQPLGFDQWMGIYSRYCVVESQCDVAVTSRAVSNRFSVAVVPVTPVGTYPSTFESASACRFAKCATTTGGGPTYRIKQTRKVCEVFGVPPMAIEADDNFSGTASASPGREGAWVIVGETSGSSDAFSLSIRVKYRVRFWNVSIVALSATRRVMPKQSAPPTLTEKEPEPVDERSFADSFYPACGGVLGRHPFWRPCVHVGGDLCLSCSCGRLHKRRDIPPSFLPASVAPTPDKVDA